MRRGIIYCYTNSINGKKYIGQTTSTDKKRKKDHRYHAFTKKDNNPFQCAIRKYGWDFFDNTYEVLFECYLEDEKELRKTLNEKENYYMDKFNTIAPNGYNVNKAHVGLERHYVNKEETYKKISEKLKGKVCYPKGQRKVINFDTKETFVSISEAGRVSGIHRDCIYNCCKGKINKAGGYKWCYVNDDGTIDDRFVNRGNLQYHKPIYCFELDRYFYSLYEVSKFLNKHYSNIKKDLKEDVISRRKVFGYTWKYVSKEEYDNHVNLVLSNNGESND